MGGEELTGALTIEGIDAHLVRAFSTRPGPHARPEPPSGEAWLLVEVGGATADEAAALLAADGFTGAPAALLRAAEAWAEAS